jgi:hypothetical protein
MVIIAHLMAIICMLAGVAFLRKSVATESGWNAERLYGIVFIVLGIGVLFA